MSFLQLDPKKVAAIVIFMIPLLLLNMKHNFPNDAWYTRPLTFATGLIQSGYSSFSNAVRNVASHYLWLLKIKEENRQLIQDNDLLKAKLTELEELRIENNQLSDLLKFKRSSPMELLSAKIIGHDPIVEHSTLVINRGTHHGVKAGMAVISVEGAVGYIFRPELMTSQILLLTDRYSVIDSVVQRSRARGVVEGKSQKECRLRYLERGDDVKVGDLVVTSGLDNIFPRGFPVATVTKVESDPLGTSQRVDLLPVANTNELEDLFIILNSNHLNLLDPEADRPEAAPAQKRTPSNKKGVP